MGAANCRAPKNDRSPGAARTAAGHAAAAHRNNRNAVHPSTMSHLQIEHRIPDHQRPLGRTPQCADLVNHQRIRLACRFIRATRDIEQVFPPLPRQDAIEPTTPFASRHREQITGLAELRECFGDTWVRHGRLSFQPQVMFTVMVAKRLDPRRIDLSRYSTSTASGSASPMMPLTAVSSTCGRPQDRAATWIDSTIRPIESTRCHPNRISEPCSYSPRRSSVRAHTSSTGASSDSSRHPAGAPSAHRHAETDVCHPTREPRE